MDLDIIIPTYRPDERFAGLMRRLGQQVVPAKHILIINTEKELWDQAAFEKGFEEKGILENGSTVEVRHIRAEEFDHGGTRAYAASLMSSEILLFMTQDAMPADRHLTEELLKVWEEETGEDSGQGIGAVYARQLPAKDCGFLERYTRSFNYGEESRVKSLEDLPGLGIKTYFCSNVCAAYKRSIYEKLGGFERRTIFNEDMIFAAGLIKNGYRVAYAAEAKVIHSHNYSGIQQFHRNFDLAVSQADHPEIFEGVRSENEGVRLVKNSAVHLIRHGKAYLLPKLVWQSGCKYLGYCMGKHYKQLPESVILRCTMNKKYWENKHF